MSGIAVGTALAIGLGTAASAGTAIYGANKQAGAAQSAESLQAQEAQNALNFQEQQWNTEQTETAPYRSAGTGALNQLNGLISGGFQAPTAQQAENTPGYQFQLQQGEQAIQRSAAAQGGLLSGGTGKALNNYAQGVASTNYQNVYQNALNQYQANYNSELGVAGLGAGVTTQGLQLGEQGAQNAGNIELTTGAQQGQDIQNAAYQTASGYGAAGNALSNLSQLGLLNSILNGSTGAVSPYNPGPGSPYANMPTDASFLSS